MTFWLDTQSFLLSFPSISKCRLSAFIDCWNGRGFPWGESSLNSLLLPFFFCFLSVPPPHTHSKGLFQPVFFLYEKILVYSIHILLHTVKMQVMISCLCPFGTSDIVSFKYLRKNVCNWAGIINTTLYIYRERDNYTLLTCGLLLIWFAYSWF